MNVFVCLKRSNAQTTQLRNALIILKAGFLHEGWQWRSYRGQGAAAPPPRTDSVTISRTFINL